MRVVTLDGADTANHFASTPFVVQPMRASGKNVTWRSSGGSVNGADSPTVTINVGNRPTGTSGAEKSYTVSGVLLGTGLFWSMALLLGQ